MFPPFDYSGIAWRKDPTDPNLFFRDGAGSEIFIELSQMLNRGDQNVFLGLTLSPTNSAAFADEAKVVDCARKSWLQIRSDIPIVAMRSRLLENLDVIVTYRVPPSDKEAQDWADQTFQVRKDVDSPEDLRYILGRVPIIPDEHGNQTFLYLIPGEKEFHFLIHAHHTPFDAGGQQTIMNRFLALLAKGITGEEFGPINWGDEVDRLTPTPWEVIKDPSTLQGPEFSKILGEVMTDLSQLQPLAYGMKVRNLSPGPTRRLAYTFSGDESAKLFEKIRELGLTVNQLAHAVVTVLEAKDNPPTSETPANAVFFYYGIVNGRDDLREPYSTRGGYPGICLAMSPLSVPVSKFIGVKDFLSKEVILSTAEIVKAAYLRQKGYKSLISIGAQQVALMGGVMKQLIGAAVAAGGKPALPPWMGAWFVGDGLGEKYLNGEFFGKSGEQVLILDDFFVSINRHDPGPVPRATSWRGRLKLSLDFNENATPKEDMQLFFEDWIRGIRLACL